MKIEHIAMYVKDLEKTKTFFEIYLNARAKAWSSLRLQLSALLPVPLTMGQDWKL